MGMTVVLLRLCPLYPRSCLVSSEAEGLIFPPSWRETIGGHHHHHHPVAGSLGDGYLWSLGPLCVPGVVHAAGQSPGGHGSSRTSHMDLVAHLCAHWAQELASPAGMLPAPQLPCGSGGCLTGSHMLLLYVGAEGIFLARPQSQCFPRLRAPCLTYVPHLHAHLTVAEMPREFSAFMTFYFSFVLVCFCSAMDHSQDLTYARLVLCH